MNISKVDEQRRIVRDYITKPFAALTTAHFIFFSLRVATNANLDFRG